jgi:hypothetical protein
MRILSKMTEAEAAEAEIDERDRYFRVNDVKYNMKVSSSEGTWREQVSVDADNSDRFGRTDSIGVVSAWKWPVKAAPPVTGSEPDSRRRMAGKPYLRQLGGSRSGRGNGHERRQ